MYEERFLKRAIEISAEALEQPGTQPFGAVVVKDGRIVGEGLNQAAAHFDPTSHSEVEAVRDACRNLATLDLTGCDLYTSCEPCSMCVATMTVAGISTLYYAASASESGAVLGELTNAERRKVDYDHVRAEIAKPIDRRVMPAQQAMSSESVAVLQAWVAKLKAAR